MSDTWYYADQGRRSEPVTTQGLKDALARMPNARDVLVWRDGFPDWKRAGDIPDLWSQPGPPPFPGAGTPQPSRPGTVQTSAAGQTNIVDLWFGFKGRTNRAKWWLVTIVNLIIMGVAVAFTGLASMADDFGSPGLFGILGLIVYLAFLVSLIAVTIRRLHDRNKAGWWALVFAVLPVVLNFLAMSILPLLGLVSFGISIWALVELGILRGTVGPNQYGEDPLAGKAQ